MPRCVLLLPLVLVSVPTFASEEGGAEQRISMSFDLSARLNWEQNNPQSYRYTMHRQCYCSSPKHVTVEVSDNQVVLVTNVENGEVVDDQFIADYQTITELLAEIDDAVVRKPDSLHVEYDRHLGYPKKVRIDLSYRIADEEIDYRLEDLEIR